MLIEFITYALTFIISAGIAVIGIMISYQLYSIHQKQVLQILLYQQIFLISFFIYGIWGNMAIHEIISDLSLSPEINKKLTVFIPILGIPFLVVSWFMLLRFAYVLNGFKVSGKFALIYFPIFIAVVFTFSVLLNNGVIKISEKPELFIVRAIIALNLFIHLFFIFPFLFPKKNKPLSKEISFAKTNVLWYLFGVIIYSGALCFFNYFGFISICVSIILLFAVSISIPLIIKLNEKTQISPEQSADIDFNSFCKLYEISKREAEIILEICSGKTNKAISEKLFITIQTVKDHNHRIFTKTGVKTRVQLSNMVRGKTGE